MDVLSSLYNCSCNSNFFFFFFTQNSILLHFHHVEGFGERLTQLGQVLRQEQVVVSPAKEKGNSRIFPFNSYTQSTRYCTKRHWEYSTSTACQHCSTIYYVHKGDQRVFCHVVLFKCRVVIIFQEHLAFNMNVLDKCQFCLKFNAFFNHLPQCN